MTKSRASIRFPFFDSRLLRISIMLFCVASLPSKGAASGPILIGKDPVEAVRTTRDLVSGRKGLSSELADGGGKLLLLSRTSYIRSLIMPLKDAGTLRECIIILPYDNALNTTGISAILDVLRRDGVSDSDRSGFSIETGALRGKIDGVPVAFFPLSAFPRSLPPGQVLVVETTYFKDMLHEIRQPMATLVRRLLLTFREHRVSVRSVLLLDPVWGPDTTLEDGYLPDLFREAFSMPGGFEIGLPPKWESFAVGEAARYFSQYPEAFQAFRKFLDLQPEAPSICYRIAMMAARDLDVPFALQWINRAASSDPGYRRGYADLATYLIEKNLFNSAEHVVQAGLSKFPNDPVLATGLANLYISLGESARERGEVDIMETSFRKASEVAGANKETVEKALRLLKSGMSAHE